MPEFKIRIEDEIANNRNWYFFQGVIFVVAGIMAFILPIATVIGLEILIGFLLMVSGIAQAFSSFKARMHWWSLFSALLSIIVGRAMVYMPSLGAIATLVTIFLFLEAITEIFLALQFRAAKRWGWLLFAGIITFLLAFFLLAGWPNIPVLFLGIMIGINLLFYGIAVLGLAI